MKSELAASEAPSLAFTTIVTRDGYEVVLAEENEGGYRPTTYGPYETEAHARRVAEACNARIGVEAFRATLIVLSSMRPMSPREHAARRAKWPELERTARLRAGGRR